MYEAKHQQKVIFDHICVLQCVQAVLTFQFDLDLVSEDALRFALCLGADVGKKMACHA